VWQRAIIAAAENNRRVNWRRVDPELFHRLCEAQNHRCPFCGVRMTEKKSPTWATFEHAQPLWRGGQDHPDNLVISCYRCNSERDNPQIPKKPKKPKPQRFLRVNRHRLVI